MRTMNLQSISRELRIARNMAAVAAFTFGMAACTQGDEPQVVTEPAPHEAVNIITQVNTRAGSIDGADGTAFTDGTEILILDKNATGKKSIYTYTAPSWTATPTLYWDELKAVDGKYSFVGVFPNDAPLAYTAGTTTDEILMAFSNGNEAKEKAILMNFKHVLSKITVTVEATDGLNIATNPVITLMGVDKTATFTYTDNSNPGFADFTPSNNGDLGSGVAAEYNDADKTAKYTFMLPAQDIKAFSFNADGTTIYKYTATTPIKLEQGQHTTLTLTVTKATMAPKTVSITPWGSTVDGGTGTLE